MENAYKEEYVQELIQREDGEVFFMGDCEAEKISFELLEKKFGNKTFQYDFDPLIKSAARLFEEI